MVTEMLTKDILGYEGLYKISEQGKVFNVKTGKEVSQFKHYKGYMCVDLHKNNKRKHMYVHRLVAMTFIPNPNNLPQVNHKNENKKDNQVSNLEWCSSKYNMNYGTRKERQFEKCKKIPVVCIETGKTYKCLSHVKSDGFHYYHVKQCCLGNEKTHKGLHWKFA